MPQAINKWGPLSAPVTQLTTGIDNQANTTRSFLFDVDNTANANLNLKIIITLASMTMVAGANLRFVARCKDGANYCNNNSEIGSVEVDSGTYAGRFCAILRLPDAGVWGIYMINNLGNSTPASGNTLRSWTFNELSDY